MSGPGDGKIHLGKADVYIHLKGRSRARITHIDIELPELNEILKPGENSFVGAKEGGVFIRLKKEMIQRIEEGNSLSPQLSKKINKEMSIKRAEDSPIVKDGNKKR